MIPGFLSVKKHRNILCYYLIWSPFIAVYQLTNRIHFLDVRELPLTWLDHAIPFLPWSIPVYVSYLIYTFIVISRSRDDREVREIFVLTHIQLGLSVLFFVFYPVTYPRDAYYYSGTVLSVFNEFWLIFDAPNNCFPSLHTILCLTAIRHSSDKPHAFIYCTWGGLIIMTTLTCKQHYAADILAGFVIYWISLRVFRYYCSWIPGKSPACPPSQSSQ